jgi:hypothetical protein
LVVVAAADFPVGSAAILSPGRLGVVLLTVSFGGGWADTPSAENTSIMTAASERNIIALSLLLGLWPSSHRVAASNKFVFTALWV